MNRQLQQLEKDYDLKRKELEYFRSKLEELKLNLINNDLGERYSIHELEFSVWKKCYMSPIDYCVSLDKNFVEPENKCLFCEKNINNV